MSRSAVVRAARARVEDLTCLVVALLVGGLATDATDVAAGGYAPVNDLVGLAAVVALWWRRRAPLVVAALTFAAAAIAPMAAGAAIVSVYTVAEERRRPTSRAVGAVYVAYLVAGAVSIVAFADQEIGTALNALVAVVMTVAAYALGVAARSRRELLVALAERAERAEADQQARVAEARRGERARIAAEMHDVLAHRLSLLSVHAGALELRPAAAPADLAAAAGVVRANAHLALEDLRTVIGVLRDDVAGDLAPPTSVADLARLVEEGRAAGMSIEVAGEVGEDGAEVPAELARHAHRVVREGLTNARKHAPGQPVRLALAGHPGDGLRIDIANPAGPVLGAVVPATVVPGAGMGLVGLRERVELAGGVLECGTDGGEHHLTVWLPWRP